MKMVTAREANQGFSKLLNEVASGESVIITSRGKPVAQMTPYSGPIMTPEREAAIRQMMDRMEHSGLKLGGKGFTRDEMHER
jgi:prevent-host-death family protein